MQEDWQPLPYEGFGLPSSANPLQGTVSDCVREDINDQVIELSDELLVHDYQRRRSQDAFTGSVLEDVMWNEICSRVDNPADELDHPDVERYLRSVHGCLTHFWTPPDKHTADGTCKQMA